MFEGIHTFIFDFYGTLAIPNIDFDLMRQQVDTIAERYGVDPAQVRHLYILEMIETVRAQLDQTSASGGEDFHHEAHASILALEIDCARRGGMLPGAMEVLQALRRAHDLRRDRHLVRCLSSARGRTVCQTAS
jgi:hypothetical protein